MIHEAMTHAAGEGFDEPTVTAVTNRATGWATRCCGRHGSP